MFIFLMDAKENESGLIVKTGGMGEFMGPTLLFSPGQIKRGDYDKFLATNDEVVKNKLPRLKYDGKLK